jgi:phosphatidylcholine synthase
MSQQGPSHLLTFRAWCIHTLTASTSIVALLTIYFIGKDKPVAALSMMLLAILIDAIDGTLARASKVTLMTPQIDGALLDNLVDFVNYVITPCVFILHGFLELSPIQTWLSISCVCLSSCYQFSQIDAKTSDHFFKGFPCYWNIAVYYLFLSKCSASFSTVILITLSALVFVPIKYVYPSRLDYLSNTPFIKRLMLFGVILYAMSSLAILYSYPLLPKPLIAYSLIFILFYLFMSIYRTLFPLDSTKSSGKV